MGVGWMVMVVGTVVVVVQTAKATTIDMAASDLTTVHSMSIVEVNTGTQGNGGFSGGMSTREDESFSTQESFSGGVNIVRDERGCRRKNGQVR